LNFSPLGRAGFFVFGEGKGESKYQIRTAIVPLNHTANRGIPRWLGSGLPAGIPLIPKFAFIRVIRGLSIKRAPAGFPRA
jgi:hypothetical protein